MNASHATYSVRHRWHAVLVGLVLASVVRSQEIAAQALATPSVVVPDSSAGIRITTYPATPLIESDDSQQLLNFDFALHNTGTRRLRLNRIEVSVADATGQTVLRRFLDGNGFAPSIETVTHSLLDADSTLAVFNPVYHFDAGVPLDRLEYRFYFVEEHDASAAAQNAHRLPVDYDVVATTVVRPERYRPRTALILPIRERAIVWDGHDYYAHHRRVPLGRPDMVRRGFRANSNRYAYDFVPVDSAGAMYRGSPYAASHWVGYGAVIRAPAAGVVISASNTIPENHYDGARVVYPVLPDSVDPIGLGNHVIIDHRNGEFSVLLHMQPGSVHVQVGDTVSQGEPLGRIGFSGDSFLPHLHYTVMRGATEMVSEGVPSCFDDFARERGSRRIRVRHGRVDSGDIIRSLR